MSGKEEQDENLKAFEAALAALQPRADRLDGRWRELLAKEASLPAYEAGTRPPCASPAGHQFVCIQCGIAAPVPSVVRHWVWPTALAGMTTIAAILLIMLVVAKEPPIASPFVAQQPANRSVSEKVQIADFRRAMSDSTRSPLASGVGEAAYLRLRGQILRDGVESWKSPVSEVVTAARASEVPLSQREQLQRLLKQQDFRGS